MRSTSRGPRNSDIHGDIATYLRQSIHDGEFRPGDPLPSEAELCERFQSSRGPVRQAMATLRTEGLISSGRGRRSIVLHNSRTESFEASISATHWICSQGYAPGQATRWVGKMPASEQVAAGLEVKPGEQIVSYVRLRTADERPVLIERANFRANPGHHVLAFDTDSGSIHQHLAEQGVAFNSISRTFDAIAASEEDAQLLGVEPGAPLQAMTLRAVDPSGTPIEYSRYVYCAHLLRLGMNIVRGFPSPLWVELSI